MYEQLRASIKSGLISSKYCCKLTYTKIESYLSDFVALSTSNASPSVSNIEILVDILFHFLRMNLNDAEYTRQLTQWLTKLTRIYLHAIETQPSHSLNLPNRCLSILTGQLHLSEFLTRFLSQFSDDTSAIFSQFIDCLAPLTCPLHSRMILLSEFSVNSNQSDENESLRESQSNNWLVVDIDGDGDAVGNTEAFANEDDLISMLTELPSTNSLSSTNHCGATSPQPSAVSWKLLRRSRRSLAS